MKHSLQDSHDYLPALRQLIPPGDRPGGEGLGDTPFSGLPVPATETDRNPNSRI